MKGPKIFVIVGWNWRTSDLIEYYFDYDDSREAETRWNAEHGEYAVQVQEVDGPGGSATILAPYERRR